MQGADIRFMRLALALGRRGLGQVAPWPSVGCVLVQGRRIVGRGTSDRKTMRHAEIVALDQAGAQAKGATAFVTLEPCSHHGNTPPCSDALINAGVARVVVATGDPNPLVAGQGLERLAKAGIEVETGLLEDAAKADHRGFLLTQTENRPMLTLKLASSFDGRIATATGESHWITGPAARREVHMMRARHDAVMIGAGTARADDPSLDVRDLGVENQPVRVVISRNLDLPMASRLAKTAGQQPLWLVHAKGADPGLISAWKGFGARLFPTVLKVGQIDMQAALGDLAEAGLTRVFCEGGGALAASLIRADLVDQLVGFSAGLALGADGTPSIGAMGLERLSDAPRFSLTYLRDLGGDVLHVWEREI